MLKMVDWRRDSSANQTTFWSLMDSLLKISSESLCARSEINIYYMVRGMLI